MSTYTVNSVLASRADLSRWLPELVAHASTLRERLDAGIVTSGDGRLARARLQRWCDLAAGGDPQILQRRLAWDGLSVESATARLGEAAPAPGRTPDWALLLEQVVARAAAAPSRETGGGLPEVEPRLPFQEIVHPFLETAAANLYELVGPDTGGLASGGRLSLERDLARRLSALCGPVLYREFAVRRARAGSGFGRLQALASETDESYRAFVSELLEPGLMTLFEEYPVLARLASGLALGWIETTAEFLHRLEADRQELEATFAGGTDPGSLRAIDSGLSDPHGGGRSVLRLTFASGLRVLYKPRDVGLEAGYQALVSWLNEQGADPPLLAPKVIDRSGYGWMEHVQQQPVADEAAAHRYYRRAGMLAALFYALGSTDCHQHNLIAAGEQPVLVDTETLLHPRLEPHGSPTEVAGARTAARRWMEESVLEADFLPSWTSAGAGRGFDMSGLGGVTPQESVILTPRWQQPNSDAMILEHVFEQLSEPANALRVGDRTLLPGQFAGAVEEGFREMHKLLEERRSLLLAPDGPLARLGESQVRFIFRPTLVYQKLLEGAWAPAPLRDGAELGLELERSARVFLKTEQPDPFWPLHREEQAALERGEIPRFTMPADSRGLPIGAEPGKEVFAASPLEHAAERIRGLDPEDRERQATLVRLSLQAQDPHPISGGTEEDDPEAPEAGYMAFAEESLRIAERLQELAIEAPDGGLAWIGFSVDDASGRTSLRPLGLDLYGGQSGLGVFFSAMAWVSADPLFREVALGALSPVLAALRERPEAVVRETGIGGGSGCGSIIYSLVTCARLLREPDLLRVAQRAADSLTRDRVAADREFDVVAGAAGAALGLLSLYEAMGSEETLSRALWCGEHLLERRRRTSAGFRAWTSHSEQPLTGFSHGAAGIAFALARLSEASGRADFLEAAEEAVAYEDSLFSAEEANWPDLRPDPPPSGGVLSSWCHGACGIGLARLGGLDVLDTPQVRADIEAALRTTRGVGRGSFDQLCCGSLGRVETLHVGGGLLSRPELDDAARELAAGVLASRRRGGFRLAPGVGSPDYAPGFFQGLSGIGYQLLRLAQPELPSVLLFEPS
jgi:type 2 lantibiotic biosynthesis protein LanM